MIKVKVKSPFIDRETKVLNKVGTELEISKERLDKLNKYVEVIKDNAKKDNNEG